MPLYKNCGWWKKIDCIFGFSVKSYVRNTINLSCAKILLTSVISTSQFVRLFCDLCHLLSDGNVVFSSFCPYRLSSKVQAVGHFTWLRQVHSAPTRSLASQRPVREFLCTCLAHACSSVTFPAVSRRRTACWDGKSFHATTHSERDGPTLYQRTIVLEPFQYQDCGFESCSVYCNNVHHLLYWFV